MRLIDADKLKAEGYALHRLYQKDPDTIVSEVIKIDDVPTIEAEPNSCKYWDSESHFCALRRPQAEPVRRGRWEAIDFANEYFKCSGCGRIERWYPNYCSRCGLKMATRTLYVGTSNIIEEPNCGAEEGEK